MTSREKVRKAINHEIADSLPLDLGSTSVTGIHASSYGKLKKLLGIDKGEIRIIDPFQMLAEVEEPVRKALGIDTCGLQLPSTLFGFKNENWKPWRLFDGTEVMVSGHFEYDVDVNGDILLYPGGDRNVPPSGRMAKDGYYFDAIIRQKPIDEEKLDPKKWVEQTYSPYSDEDLRYLEKTSRWLFEETDYAIIGNFCDGGLGDIGVVPGLNVKEPEGIRDPEEWYISLITRREYIHEIFARQTELVLKNLRMYQEACGERIDVIDVSETDFGGQRGLLISVELFKNLFKPYLKQINTWIKNNTNWKIFYHTCGSIMGLIDELIEIGVDILNPVQYTAEKMELGELKHRYGDKLVFWGGGVDTQRVLPFGKPDNIRDEVKKNVRILSKGGGFVFSTVHNLQANVPAENLKALFDAFESCRVE
ncbi:MAG: uroporphyrinogen decarboxylase family protein [Spirochaetota bacterium]